MPNSARSSFEIELNGAEYTLRPSFEAVVQFNDISGMDIFDAFNEVVNKKRLPAKVIVACIWAGIKGEYEFQGDGMKCPSYKKIGEECQKHGFSTCLSHAITFLSKSIASDEDIKKFDEAQKPQD